MVDTIEEHGMNPKTVARLRKAVHDLVDAETPKVDAKQMEKQLGTITAKSEKAKRRLLEVPADMIAVVSEGIRELRTQQEQMESALRTASKPRGALFADADERIDAAVSRFTQLRQVLDRADEVQQREIIRQTVRVLGSAAGGTPNVRRRPCQSTPSRWFPASSESAALQGQLGRGCDRRLFRSRREPSNVKCGFMADANDKRLSIRIGMLGGHCRVDEFIAQKKRLRYRLDGHEPVAVLGFEFRSKTGFVDTFGLFCN